VTPTGRIVTEGKHYSLPGNVVKVAVLAGDRVALAMQDEGSPDAVVLQSSDFRNVARWEPGANRKIEALAAHADWLGAAGIMDPSGLWLGVVDGQSAAPLWTQPRAELAIDTRGPGANVLGIEIDAAGHMNAAVWTGLGSYLLLDGSKDRAATASATLDTNAPIQFGRMVNAAVRTQSDGSLLWAGELWGRYCRK